MLSELLSDEASNAREFIEKTHEMARVRFFSRSGKYKVLPYGFSLAKNALGEGDTKDEAWIDAANKKRSRDQHDVSV